MRAGPFPPGLCRGRREVTSAQPVISVAIDLAVQILETVREVMSGLIVTAQVRDSRLVQPQEFPADALIVDTPAPNLPNAHNGIPHCACPYCMDFNYTGETVIPEIPECIFSSLGPAGVVSGFQQLLAACTNPLPTIEGYPILKKLSYCSLKLPDGRHRVLAEIGHS